MKQLMPCPMMLFTFSRIFSRSAFSMSATCRPGLCLNLAVKRDAILRLYQLMLSTVTLWPASIAGAAQSVEGCLHEFAATL